MPRKAKTRFVVSEPGVYVVGKQEIVWPQVGRFLDDEGFPGYESLAMTPAEYLAEFAGRLCYLSFGGGRAHDEYIRNLKRDRHGSVLEHATINLIFTGVSRTFTHETVRHRAGWSYSQLSQRYVDESDAQVVCPAIVWRTRDDPRWGGIYTRWVAAARAARDAYRSIAGDLDLYLEPPRTGGDDKVKDRTRIRKLINGAARSLLPGASETKIFCTVNARAFRHWLEMRATQQADPEIRAVAMAAYRAVIPFWPQFLADYVVRTDEAGDEYLSTEYSKV